MDCSLVVQTRAVSVLMNQHSPALRVEASTRALRVHLSGLHSVRTKPAHTLRPARPSLRISCATPPDGSAEESSQSSGTGSAAKQETSPVIVASEPLGNPPAPRKRKSSASSTDWISSALTRRFGIAGGFAWLAFLSFGVISEQVKTRREVYEAEQGTRDVGAMEEVVRPSGVKYIDLRVGGGVAPQRGDILTISLVGRVLESDTAPFIDTTRSGRDIAFFFKGRPLAAGLCIAVEEELATMRAGGRRKIVVPPELGFGAEGLLLPSGALIPGNATLEYTVGLNRVSIPPS